MPKLSTKMVGALVIVIVALIVIFTTLAETGSDVGNAANNLTESVNGSGVCVSGGQCGGSVYPLANLFKSKGVILLALMAGIAITLITGLLAFGGKGKK